ncbi:hypothetical protein PCE1_001388 [Barthelona sp. PCE]
MSLFFETRRSPQKTSASPQKMELEDNLHKNSTSNRFSLPVFSAVPTFKVVSSEFRVNVPQKNMQTTTSFYEPLNRTQTRAKFDFGAPQLSKTMVNQSPISLKTRAPANTTLGSATTHNLPRNRRSGIYSVLNSVFTGAQTAPISSPMERKVVPPMSPTRFVNSIIHNPHDENDGEEEVMKLEFM